MIPLSSRPRESGALSHISFTYDPDSVKKLENAVGAYHGYSFCIAFNTPESATAGALAAAGVIRNGPVISGAMGPQYHLSATAHIAAAVRFCDIRLDGNLSARALSELVDTDAAAVILNAFEGIRPQRPELPGSVRLIEDMTASLSPAPAGGTVIWSLEALMPEGVEKTGFILTEDSYLAELLLHYRNFGRKPGSLWNYDVVLRGGDGTLSALAASIALHQTAQLDWACCQRLRHADRLDKALAGSSLIDRLKHSPADDLRSYPFLLIPALYCPKEDIYTAIRDNGVESSVCCKPAYKTAAFREEKTRLSVTEDFYKALLQVPCHHRLTPAEVDKVAKTVLQAVDAFGYRGCSF